MPAGGHRGVRDSGGLALSTGRAFWGASPEHTAQCTASARKCGACDIFRNGKDGPGDTVNVGVSQVVKIAAVADCVRILDGGERRPGHLLGLRVPTVPSSPQPQLGAAIISASTARSGRSIVVVQRLARARQPPAPGRRGDPRHHPDRQGLPRPLRHLPPFLVPAGCGTKEMQMKECHVAT